jgi:anti-sigma B factor antagonist
MPETATKPVYLVDAYSEPVLVRIEGRAHFQNSACLRDFITEMRKHGKNRFVIDFQHCTSMDSTFLGVLAGAALEAGTDACGKGRLVLVRVGARNLELIRNLGLHRLMTVDPGDTGLAFEECRQGLSSSDRSELDNARLALEAHENLIAADEGNRGKFQDVVVFLRNRVERS